MEPEMEYLEYEVLDDDSLFGVSLKFNIWYHKFNKKVPKRLCS